MITITAARILAEMELLVLILKLITTATVLKDGKEKTVAKANFCATILRVTMVSVIFQIYGLVCVTRVFWKCIFFLFLT